MQISAAAIRTFYSDIRRDEQLIDSCAPSSWMFVPDVLNLKRTDTDGDDESLSNASVATATRRRQRYCRSYSLTLPLPLTLFSRTVMPLDDRYPGPREPLRLVRVRACARARPFATTRPTLQGAGAKDNDRRSTPPQPLTVARRMTRSNM